MKNPTFKGGGGVHEKLIYGGLPKKGGELGQFVNLKGLGKKEGVVTFLEGRA